MPDISFSIKVVNGEGDPCGNITVFVRDKAILGGSISEKTDEDGWAEFTFHNFLDYWIYAEVYIGRNESINHTFYNEETASFTYSSD